MKLSKAQIRLLRGLDKRGNLYFDDINERFCFTGKPIRLDKRTIFKLEDMNLIAPLITGHTNWYYELTPAGVEALAAAEGGKDGDK